MLLCGSLIFCLAISILVAAVLERVGVSEHIVDWLASPSIFVFVSLVLFVGSRKDGKVFFTPDHEATSLNQPLLDSPRDGGTQLPSHTLREALCLPSYWLHGFS